MTKLKIEFAPGCFDNFDGTQEELDELINEIRMMVDDGTFEEKSTRLPEEEEEAILKILQRRNTRQ
jgi:hypothetical protein